MAFNFEVNPVAINNITKTVENLSKSLKLQDKTVEIDSNGQEIVTADSEYDGLGKVTINTDVPTKPEEVLTETITENGLKTFNPTAGSVFSSASITVNVPEKKIEAEKTVNITENKETVITPTPDNEGIARVVVTTNVPQPTLEENKTQTISSNSVVEVTPSAGNDGMKKATITVNVPEKKIEANKTQSIVTNGETVITPTEDNDGMAKVTVNVNVPESVLQESKSVNITENKTESVSPDEGYDAIKRVDVTVNIPLEEKKTQTISSNSTVTIIPTEGNTAMKSVEVTVNVPSSGSGFDFTQIGYTSEENTEVNDELKAQIAYSKSLYDEWDPEKKDASNLYRGDRTLVYAPHIDTSNVTNMLYMFYTAVSLKYVPSLNTSKVTTMQDMFRNCVSLEEIPDFDYSKVTNVQAMFQGTKIRSFQANLPLVINAAYIFSECSSLKTIGTLNVPNVTIMLDCFRGCTNLTTIGGLVGLKADVDFKDCRNLSNESIQNLIDNAADVTSLGTKTMKFAATPFATITEEQTAAATAKGWTLASA